MSASTTGSADDTSALEHFHPTLRRWFLHAFPAPTRAQTMAWPAIARGKNTLLLAPTGSGKTLAAFLVAIDRIMFDRRAQDRGQGVRVLYVSPLKALGVDVERNLRSPIAGVKAVAEQTGTEHRLPTIGVRTGDTSTADRYRLNRQPPEILITTPESLYLMLTSRARDIMQTVETVIVDEIHSLVATKRGAHLFFSLERLERQRRMDDPQRTAMQRIGLSATQRPLAEVARLLGGAELSGDADNELTARPVQVIDAGQGKQLDLQIEFPVEEMARRGASQTSGPATAGPRLPSIWPAIHPRLVELIRQHRTMMIFVNSRRLAERLAAAINELAEEELALAHHGSIAKQTRLRIEDRLKRGQLAAIVATSSLELGIDMGSVDLVIQIQSPPSIASGIQRIGRAGHQVGARSSGVIFPKYRGDLLACSAATPKMARGEVEETFYPRNPLDVLAQQLVAMVSQGPVTVDQLYRTTRCAAPFHELPRSAFEGVLDLLAGRYPSDEFAGLRPLVNWDRIGGEVSPRRGTQRVAILNAGTIPDRGLYGVYLARNGMASSRVGELDEEMVFETKPGEVFLLGASSWRVVEITHDRVLVVPAPGEPGKMPFWKGDGPGRPLEFGRSIGALVRCLLAAPRQQSEARLTEEHGLKGQAARNLLDYLHEQAEATGEAPTDETIVVESFLDEVGDWRVTILSHYGARIHAPWATAVAGRLRAETGAEVDMMWSDDGIVFRLPESDNPPEVELLFPRADEIEDLVVRELGATALFAAKFRENAARALLLPRRRPGHRTPLWLQRRKAADLLSVASRYREFPILLETYRECLRDVFDIRGLRRILQDVERRAVAVRTVQTQTASPFATSLLFNYTANFIYDGDAPLAERRAQTLALDHTQLRQLLGDAELRDLLDAATVEEVALQLQRLDGRFPVKHVDAMHELLLKIGDLDRDELAARCDRQLVQAGELDQWVDQLCGQRRIIEVHIAGQTRYAAAEDAARYRDALSVVLPPGLPDAFLENVDDPLGDLVSRYARTHVPFPLGDITERFGLGPATVATALERLAARDRVLEGEFLPGGRGLEWCDAEVLRRLKRRSLAVLRQQVEPVELLALARFLPHWQGVVRPRRGQDGLLDVIEQLQGMPLPASTLDRHILPSRLIGYQATDLDELCTAGEIVWRGCERLGPGDGRIALYLTDRLPQLAPPAAPIDDDLGQRIGTVLAEQGAVFFEEIVKAIGGFPNDILNALWQLVWSGHVTNDTLAPLRSLRREHLRPARRASRGRRAFRSRRRAKTPGSEGRWSRLGENKTSAPSPTQRQTAIATQLIDRYGIVTRELVASEGVVGGFAGLYPVLKAMEEAGKIRRGYFVEGLGAAQFAAPGAEDQLRQFSDSSRDQKPPGEVHVLAATDPANPYGAAWRWPSTPDQAARPQRAAGARVFLLDGALVGYLGRTGQQLTTFLPEPGPDRARVRRLLAETLAAAAPAEEPVFLTKVDGLDVRDSQLASDLQTVGFVPSQRGYLRRRKVES